ncbi:hypothetical protein ACFLS0_04850 [Candidatus Bipolaricaulota bacterium]
MAFNMLPEKPIPLRVARDWSSYKKNLDATPLVRKHLLGILKGWVENPKIQNPLALPWLRHLIDGDLRSLEKHLAEFENYMGESNLSKLIPDLLPVGAPLQHTHRSLSALFGEVMTFRKLRELGAENVAKLTTWGDWQADELTVSVKTILDIDSNYKLIEDVVEGLGCLEEYPAMRATSHFRIFNGNGLDDRFLAKVLDFLHVDLEETLQYLVSGMGYPKWVYCSVEALRIPEVAGTNEKGRLRANATRHNGKQILIALEDIRGGESPEQRHRIEFKIKLRQGVSYEFSANNDFNAWSGEPEIDRQKLRRQIVGKLETVAIKNKGKDISGFAAWINIEAHPSLESGIAGHPGRIKALISELVEEVKFPVLVYIYGGFELKKPLLLKFGPETKLFSGIGDHV